MDKTAFFKKMLRGKHLLKMIGDGKISTEEKKELKQIMSFFGDHLITEDERKYLKEKHNVEKTQLDTDLELL